MSTFIDRMQVELEELNTRIDGLEKFMTNKHIEELSNRDYDLLEQQLKAMQEYQMVLSARLVRCQYQSEKEVIH